MNFVLLLTCRLKVIAVVLLNAASFFFVAFGGSAVVWLSITGISVR